MKIGDLVRLKSNYPSHPNPGTIGLVIDIDWRRTHRIEVQWFGSRNYVEYRGLNELEVINENR